MLLASLAIFTVFSLACAVSQTLIQLIVFRALAGIGGAGIATLALIMYVLAGYYINLCQLICYLATCSVCEHIYVP